MADPKIGSAPQRPSVTILGVQIQQIDFAGMLDQIDEWVDDPNSARTPRTCRQICTVNPEFLVDAWRDPQFAAVLQQADLCVPDGIGVLWAANLLGTSLHERVTGSDGIFRVCERAAERGWRVFLLGAAPGVAELAAVRLRDCYPALTVCGVHSGNPTDDEWPCIRDYLIASKPHILFVAYGHPRQDAWIRQHLDELPAHVAIGVGGAFDFAAGVAQRAPMWMRRTGIEWLYRLLSQPWRWRRMIKLPLFVGLVMNEWQQRQSGGEVGD